MLTIKALIEGDGLRAYFYRHPPLFTILSSVVSYPLGDNHYIAQMISVAFSILSLIPLYLLSERLFDRRIALFSMLFVAVMPLNILYSTWVKQDAMLLFFFLLSIYFYIDEKPYKSGIAFGIASLTKEFAWFLIPVVVSWQILKGWDRKASATFLKWLLIGTATSGWWYLIFGGISFNTIASVMSGEQAGYLFDLQWQYPWYYYLLNLPTDLSYTLIPFFLIGLFLLLRAKKLFLILWLMSFYIPLSLITVKAPWYTYLASPAISIITAGGFVKVWDAVRPTFLKIAITVIMTALIGLNLYRFDGTKQYERLIARDIPDYYEIYETEYLSKGRKALKGQTKVGLLEGTYTLQYYLGITDKRVYPLGLQLPNMSREDFENLTRQTNIGFFVINTDSLNVLDKNIADLTLLYGEPQKVGNLLIYSVL